MPQTLTGIPNDKVGEIVQSFIDNDGAIRVIATQNALGTWDVTAYFKK